LGSFSSGFRKLLHRLLIAASLWRLSWRSARRLSAELGSKSVDVAFRTPEIFPWFER
jgi:hypothetical protein